MPVGCCITDVDLDTQNGSVASEGGQPVAHDEPDKARQDKIPLAEGHQNEQNENHHQAHPQARMVMLSIWRLFCLTDF